MSGNWENYFKDKQSERDVFVPDEDRMWNQIDKRMKQKRLSLKQWAIRVAVVAGIFLSIGVFIRHEMMMNKQLDSLAFISEELAKQESQYIQAVSLKWDEFISMPSEDMVFEQALLEELSLLDTIYTKGLNDMKQHGYNERAVIIMLDTYEKRLRIIERLINEKRKLQKDENKSKQIRI
ncbi:hypothetical protein [Carboxylicivirga sp. M1479]|uniref:hypothetical protein n=1 Tax=Carboxylicivirga sp. M1479 TaxID=2594476 RepID=UPI0011788FD8|nr:hypothetical protein [Carboxylicivirga sp. M1479]TRX71710.1 hypothetical protein FNN09_05585 [Carboxylicivirga sp. M1479]